MPGFLPSELPVRATVRQHRMVIARRPSRNWAIFWAVWVVLAVIWVNPMAWVAVLLFGGAIWLRWRTWKHDRIYLTGKRIVRLEGLPETTEIEAWMRLDRVSGMRIERSVLGRALGYATIVLEAPGNHPATRKLEMIASPVYFYGVLRKLVLDGPNSSDPNDTGAPAGEYVTAPLPKVSEHDRVEQSQRRRHRADRD